jgi:hypothetical protein
VMAAAASPWRRRPQQHSRPPTSQERPPLPARRDEDEEEDLVTWFFSSPSHPSETDYTSFHLLSFRQKVRGARDWSGMGWDDGFGRAAASPLGVSQKSICVCASP